MKIDPVSRRRCVTDRWLKDKSRAEHSASTFANGHILVVTSDNLLLIGRKLIVKPMNERLRDALSSELLPLTIN